MIESIKKVNPELAAAHEKNKTNAEDLKKFIYDYNYEIMG